MDITNLKKELEAIDLKISERNRQLDILKSNAWQLKALIKADERHKAAIENAIAAIK